MKRARRELPAQVQMGQVRRKKPVRGVIEQRAPERLTAAVVSVLEQLRVRPAALGDGRVLDVEQVTQLTEHVAEQDGSGTQALQQRRQPLRMKHQLVLRDQL